MVERTITKDRIVATVLTLLLLAIVSTNGKPQQLKPGCRYAGRRYQEGTAVSTSEPCLQCRCTEGALRCRLRICPRLPNLPPPGCHVRPPGENVCCAELVCGESRNAENMLRKTNVQPDEDADEEAALHHPHSEGCLYEGVRYAPGSAMMGSRRCEYCYCISGARRCIRPKCLLPLPGCTPLYAPHSCCPVSYNCTHLHSSTTAPISQNGCRVDDRVYEEGEMVRDIDWKASCDNCFCAMGAIRCVPLSCAPPLQGCSPIVREGQCCPSTYNCSGSIEVKATQNYASYAFISKDYAKFRKETNFLPVADQTTSPPVEGRGHRVVEERVSTTDVEEGSSLATDSTSWASTYETDIIDNKILIETVDYTRSTFEATAATTLPSTEELSTNTESTVSDTTSTTKDADLTTESSASYAETIRETITEDSTTTPLELTTIPSSVMLRDNTTEGEKNFEALKQDVNSVEKESSETVEKSHNTTAMSNDESTSSTVIAALAQNAEEERHANKTVTEGSVKGPVTSPSSTILMPDDILVMNVTVKTNVSVGHIQGVTINPIRSIPPDVEAILNITHREKGEDYDYDYSEPTLPPSLPNVRIIPFVAADALVKDKEVSPVTGYPSGSVVVSPELRPTDTSGFYDIATQENRFSPPSETEGGFVPREPPYFDAPYHSTDLNLKIGTGVTVVPAPITNPHRKNNDLPSNCLFENIEYRHGEILPSAAMCIICMCYYGEVVCSSEKCPPLKIGCRRISTEERCCGKIVCVEAGESPTVVLDRADATAPSQRQPTVSPDPFRDVIKTKPAPDLPSLIEDMIPYLVEHGITTQRPTTPTTTANPPVQSPAGSNHPHPTSYNFMEKVPLIHPLFDYRQEAVDGLLVKTEYGLNRDGSPSLKETLPLIYNLKDSEQTAEHKPEETGTFVHERTTLARMDSTTVSPRESPLISNVTIDTKNGSETDSNIKGKLEQKSTSPATTSTEDDDSSDLEGSIFSLDSVLDLLLSSDEEKKKKKSNTKVPEVSTTEATTRNEVTVSSSSVSSSPLTPTAEKEEEIERTTGEAGTIETSSKVLDNEIPISVASLLKLAGCNIYGRMYRVGRIITELSSPCLECRCTEIGVQCKQLEC